MDKFKEIQAVAFDLDGTLVNSAPALTQATNLMLSDLSLPLITEAQVKTWVGNGVDRLIERALTATAGDFNAFDVAKPLFTAHYDAVMTEGTTLYPHVKETLIALRQRGYPLALVTNKPAMYLPELLASLHIADCFDLVIGGGDVIKLKPHPAPIFHVLAHFGLFPDQLAFVGDSKNDILAAKQANCRTIALTYGYNYGVPIATESPDALCDHFDAILDLLPSTRNEPLK